MEACFVHTPRKGPQVVTLILSALSVIRRVYIDFVVYSQYQHSRTYLFGTTIDYCEYIASTESYTNPVAKIVYAVAMQKFPHALLKCPASGVPLFMRKFDCIREPGSSWNVLECSLKNPRHSAQLLNIAVNIDQTIPKVYITTNVYVKQRQHLMFLYGTTFEYCEFLMHNDTRQTNPVAVLIYNYAKFNFPQLLKPCPVEGIYNVSDLRVDKNLIPPFVTPGAYFSTQRFHNKRNETFFAYEAEFSVAAPSIFNRTMTMFALK
uniref:Sema domain-containing protein n=1 Tax=Anopheles culicifacies TaxID=139723 RepID=A0A182MSL3_9DIPT